MGKAGDTVYLVISDLENVKCELIKQEMIALCCEIECSSSLVQALLWACFTSPHWGTRHHVCQLLSSPANLLTSSDRMCTCLVQSPLCSIPNCIRALSVPARIREVVAGFFHQINEINGLPATGAHTKAGHVHKNYSLQPAENIGPSEMQMCIRTCSINCPFYSSLASSYFLLQLPDTNTDWVILCHLLLQSPDNKAEKKAAKRNKTEWEAATAMLPVFGNSSRHKVKSHTQRDKQVDKTISTTVCSIVCVPAWCVCIDMGVLIFSMRQSTAL